THGEAWSRGVKPAMPTSRHTDVSRTRGAGSAGGAGPGSAEDHGPVAVQEDAVLAVPADGAGEGQALDVAAHGHQLLRAVAVVDAGDLLFDDRPLVEVGGDVVGGGADQLHGAGVRL